MININYVVKQILNDTQINTDCIEITKSKKTLEYYHNYWINILKLIGNDCNFIMKQMLNDMQIHTDYVKVTKSKKTLEYYRSY